MLKKIADHFEEIVLAPGFAVMLVINFANVLSRYVLKTSWAFTEELCVMMFVYVTFFGAAVAAKRRQHLGFTLILDKLPPAARLVVNTLILIAELAFLVALIHYGNLVCANQIKYKSVTAALRISTACAGASVPISGIFIIIRTIQLYVSEVKADIARLKGAKKS